jgi:hypothetical protein
MNRTKRDIYVEALEILLKGRIAFVVKARDWQLLREVARLAHEDAPLVLSKTDPALFQAWRTAVSRFHMAGWTHMTPARVDAVQSSLQEKADEINGSLTAA